MIGPGGTQIGEHLGQTWVEHRSLLTLELIQDLGDVGDRDHRNLVFVGYPANMPEAAASAPQFRLPVQLRFLGGSISATIWRHRPRQLSVRSGDPTSSRRPRNAGAPPGARPPAKARELAGNPGVELCSGGGRTRPRIDRRSTRAALRFPGRRGTSPCPPRELGLVCRLRPAPTPDRRGAGRAPARDLFGLYVHYVASLRPLCGLSLNLVCDGCWKFACGPPRTSGDVVGGGLGEPSRSRAETSGAAEVEGHLRAVRNRIGGYLVGGGQGLRDRERRCRDRKGGRCGASALAPVVAT